MELTTWRAEIVEHLKLHGMTWDDIEDMAVEGGEEALDKQFDPGFGGEEGAPFTVWTPTRVLFPWCYDGSEGVTSVARHPNGTPTHHIGG